MKNNPANIIINSNFITNFKPTITNNLKSVYNLKNNKRIFCKNFLMYILLVKYKNNLCENSSIFIKKQKKKIYTILRSPYRHKLARHQINLNRYFIQNSLKIKLKNHINFKNWDNFIKFLNFIKSTNKFFESNLIYVNNINLFIPFSFNNNFLLKNYV